MLRTRLARLVLLGVVATGAGTVLLGATPIKVVSGTIRSVDRAAGTLAIRPQSPASAIDQSFRIGSATVVAIGQGPGELSTLEAGQKVTLFYDPGTRLVSKLRVAVAPGLDAPGTEGKTSRIALRPRLSDPMGRGSSSGGNSAYVLEVAPARTIRAVLTYETTMPGVSASEWVVYAPLPPELPAQRNVRAVLSPGGHLARDLSPSPRPLLVALVPADRPDRERTIAARAEYQATLVSRHLKRREPGERVPISGSLDPQVRQAALAKGGSFDLDAPAFRRWLDENQLARGQDEGQVDYARRVFLAVKRGFSYEFAETMDRHASRVCSTGRSDCGGLSLVFAAALRSQGIPARILVGRWALSAQPGERLGGSPYYQWHIKAEFFADGVGWVPADPAMALVYDRSPEGLRYFGQDNGDFLTFRVDPDLLVDTIHFGPKSMFCMNGGLGVWVSGSGSLGRVTTRQDWQVQALAPPSRLTGPTDEDAAPAAGNAARVSRSLIP